MFCRNCGKEIRDGARFCPGCGAKQTETVIPGESSYTESGAFMETGNFAEAGMPGQPSFQADPGIPQLEPKGNKKKTLLIVGAAVLVIVLAAGTGVLFGTGILGGSKETVAERDDRDDQEDREEKEDRDDQEDRDRSRDKERSEQPDEEPVKTEDEGRPGSDRGEENPAREEDDEDGRGGGFLDRLGGKEQSATYTMEQEAGGVIIRDVMTLKAKGDKVYEIAEDMEVDMTSMSNADVEDMIPLYDDIVEAYGFVDGVTAMGSCTNKVYYINVTIDTTGDAVGKLAELGLLSIEGNADGISLKASGEAMEQGGYTKVE